MLHVFAGFSWLKHQLTTIDVWSDSFPPWDAQLSSQWQDSKYASGSGGVNARNNKQKAPEKERSMSRKHFLRYSWAQIKRLVWALNWKAIGRIHQMFTLLLCWLQIFVERKKMEVELQMMKVNFSWKPPVVSHPIWTQHLVTPAGWFDVGPFLAKFLQLGACTGVGLLGWWYR